MNKYSIYGAIIGDVAGSHLEVLEMKEKENGYKVSSQKREKVLDPNTILFTDDCSLTDDSILTVALADALLNNKDYCKYLKEYGKQEIDLGKDKYGRSRFGKCFCEWLNGDFIGNSFGNGCAMRISPIAYAFSSLEETLKECNKATICTHNHEDSLKCARAVCGAIYLARTNKSKEEIKNFVEKELDIKLNFDLKYLRDNYIFTSKAINSVPQAIYCFLVSNSFEETLRNTLSIGGDVDTTAAISCSIASAFYNIPQNFINKVKEYIKPEYLKILEQFSITYLEA
ncbi:MAG: ADP-ribosylglycohydrolase family protein [Clostridiales bacterium]|nr:ADP-ribosylglycohydrolase family protein [Clostridiales bacterium]